MDSSLKILHPVVTMSLQFYVLISNIAIITVKDIDYRCIIRCNISRYEAINFSKNSVLDDAAIYKKYPRCKYAYPRNKY